MEESCYWKGKYFVDRETGRIIGSVEGSNANYGTYFGNYKGESILFIDEESAKKWVEKCVGLDAE
jgi:hypothetical protein